MDVTIRIDDGGTVNCSAIQQKYGACGTDHILLHFLRNPPGLCFWYTDYEIIVLVIKIVEFTQVTASYGNQRTLRHCNIV